MFTGPAVIMMLANIANTEGSILTAVGVGVSVRDPSPIPMSILGAIRVPREQLGRPHRLEIFLTDEDGESLPIELASGQSVPSLILDMTDFTGLQDERIKTPYEAAFTANVPPFPLPQGRSFAWQAYLDGETRPEWSAPFRTTPPEPPAA